MRRGDGKPGRMDPARQQEMLLARLKETLGSSDEEWQVIEPLVKKITDLRRNSMRGGPPGPSGGPPKPNGGSPKPNGGSPKRNGGPPKPIGGPPNKAPGNESHAEAQALHKTLQSADATTDDIQAKLTALRAARQRKDEEIKQACEELRQLLTIRQEATLVMMGILD